MRRIFYIFATLSLVFLSIGVVEAAKFEVSFPTITGPSGTPLQPENVGEVGPLGWVRYAYYLAFALIGLAALWGMLQAAITRLTSTSSERIAEANDRIKGVMLGLALAATAVATLEMINPDLINLRQPTITGLESAPFDFGDGLGGPQEFGDECTRAEDCTDVSWLPDAGALENLGCDTSIGRCRVKPGRTCGNVRDATRANPCFEGYYCDERGAAQTDVCEEKKGVGGECNSQGEGPLPGGVACLSGRCSNNQCTAPEALTPTPQGDVFCNPQDLDACSEYPGYECRLKSAFENRYTCQAKGSGSSEPVTITAASDATYVDIPQRYTFTVRGKPNEIFTLVITWSDTGNVTRTATANASGVATHTETHTWKSVGPTSVTLFSATGNQSTTHPPKEFEEVVNVPGTGQNQPPLDRSAPSPMQVTRGTDERTDPPFYSQTTSIATLSSAFINGDQSVDEGVEAVYTITARANPGESIYFYVLFDGADPSVRALRRVIAADAQGMAEIKIPNKFFGGSTQGAGSTVRAQVARANNTNQEASVWATSRLDIVVTRRT